MTLGKASFKTSDESQNGSASPTRPNVRIKEGRNTTHVVLKNSASSDGLQHKGQQTRDSDTQRPQARRLTSKSSSQISTDTNNTGKASNRSTSARPSPKSSRNSYSKKGKKGAEKKRSSAEELEAVKAKMQRYKKQLDRNYGQDHRGRSKVEGGIANVKEMWITVAHLVSVLLVLAVFQDVSHNGWGTSNGRFISFMDGLNTCYQYRKQKVPSKSYVRRSSFYHASMCVDSNDGIRITAAHFFIKFGMSTCVSILLGTSVGSPSY